VVERATEPVAGAGRTPSVLLAGYTVFAIAAGGRATVQLLGDPGRATVAYTLSAAAALVYLCGGLALRSRTARGRRLALALAGVELGGVLAVGTASLAVPGWFPERSVWSGYGSGYGFAPVVLPLLAVLWLRRQRR